MNRLTKSVTKRKIKRRNGHNKRGKSQSTHVLFVATTDNMLAHVGKRTDKRKKYWFLIYIHFFICFFMFIVFEEEVFGHDFKHTIQVYTGLSQK